MSCGSNMRSGGQFLAGCAVDPQPLPDTRHTRGSFVFVLVHCPIKLWGMGGGGGAGGGGRGDGRWGDG